MPTDQVTESVQFVGIDEASRQEYFLAGTAMLQVVALASEANQQQGVARIKIQSPVDGTILALDPDIPLNAQKLFLKATISQSDARAESLRWFIADDEIGSGSGNLWSPKRGQHRIVLKDKNAKVLDQVFISVR